MRPIGWFVRRIILPDAMVVRGRGSRYSTGMKVAFELPLAQAEKLRDEAKRLGLAPENSRGQRSPICSAPPTTNFA
jgi:hypothetical protein